MRCGQILSWRAIRCGLTSDAQAHDGVLERIWRRAAPVGSYYVLERGTWAAANYDEPERVAVAVASDNDSRAGSPDVDSRDSRNKRQTLLTGCSFHQPERY